MLLLGPVYEWGICLIGDSMGGMTRCMKVTELDKAREVVQWTSRRFFADFVDPGLSGGFCFILAGARTKVKQ